MSVFVCKRHIWWRQIWRHLHVTTLQCWTKFSNGLVRWSIRMMLAKNYETVSKFVKVMPRILRPLFSRTRCIVAKHTSYSKCLNKWIGGEVPPRICNFQPHTPTLSRQTLHFLNHRRWCHHSANMLKTYCEKASYTTTSSPAVAEKEPIVRR